MVLEEGQNMRLIGSKNIFTRSMIWVTLIIISFFCTVPLVSAKPIKFQREYRYEASEADSKLSSRAIALEQVKRLLLEEMGTYFISETEVKNSRLTKDQVRTFTAGIVSTTIISERWDGQIYFVKAMIEADPDEVIKHIDALMKRQKTILKIPKWLEKYVEFAKTLPDNALLAPGSADFESSRKLIISALLYGRPPGGTPWFVGMGMLGVSKLPQTNSALNTQIGFESFFTTTAFHTQTTKMERIERSSDSLLVYFPRKRDGHWKFGPWIFSREHYLGTIGRHLYDRFEFFEGSFSRKYPIKTVLTPSKKRYRELKSEIGEICRFYEQTKEKGFDDKTLGDAIGLAMAFINYDDPHFTIKNFSSIIFPFSQQIYDDTARAVIREISTGKRFFRVLFWEMYSRGLNKEDMLPRMLFLGHPRDQYLAFLKIVIDDFNLLEELLKTEKKN